MRRAICGQLLVDMIWLTVNPVHAYSKHVPVASLCYGASKFIVLLYQHR